MIRGWFVSLLLLLPPASASAAPGLPPGISPEVQRLAGLAEVVITAAAFTEHLVAYAGFCGPYAPDIARHPCDLETYGRNFFSPFAKAGLMMLSLQLASRCQRETEGLQRLLCLWRGRHLPGARE